MLRSETSLVSLENAGVYSENRWLVRGVDLSIDPEEIVTLIGPNGSGKSTTAKMVLGLKIPDEGSTHHRAGLLISYVPQKISIDWTLPLNVQRFMELTGKISQKTMTHVLEATDVAHLTSAQMSNLSGGELQRVLLARAIARKPELLILDEPVQGVDFAGEISLYNLIKEIRNELGCAILLISHDLHVVMAATDRVICLNGHVCCSGTPGSVASSPEYTALFGTRANPALAIYQHHHDHTHLPDGTVYHSHVNERQHPDHTPDHAPDINKKGADHAG